MSALRGFVRWRPFRTLVAYFPEGRFGDWLRRRFWSLRVGGVDFAYVGFGATIDFNLVAGDRVEIGHHVQLEISKSLPVYIGNDVQLANGIYLRSANHRFDSLDVPITQQGHEAKRVSYDGREYSIVIEEDVWIGARAIIISGAHIGRGSVIGAGSLVNGVIPPYSIAVGSPARVIGNRKDRAAKAASVAAERSPL